MKHGQGILHLVMPLLPVLDDLQFLHPIRYEPVTITAAVPGYWPIVESHG